MLFVVSIEPGGRIPVHTHGPADVTIYILEGQGVFSVNKEQQILKAETALYVPVGAGIGLENVGKDALRFVAAIAHLLTWKSALLAGSQQPPS